MAVKLPAAGVMIGRTLSEITLPYGTTVVLVVSADGRTKIPDGDVVIEGEDELVALSPTTSTAELWEVLTELR